MVIRSDLSKEMIFKPSPNDQAAATFAKKQREDYTVRSHSTCKGPEGRQAWQVKVTESLVAIVTMAQTANKGRISFTEALSKNVGFYSKRKRKSVKDIKKAE